MAEKDEQQSVTRKSIEQLREEVKKATKEALERAVNPTEFFYLLSRYPYLEIGNFGADIPPEEAEPKIHALDNGWVIHDYDYRLRCGKPALLAEHGWESFIQGLLGSGESEEEDGGDGTIVMQFVDAATAMVQLAKELGWEGIEIIRGFYPMRRAAWIAAVSENVPLRGFESTFEDRVVLNWVQQMKTGEMFQGAKLRMGSSE